MGYLYAYLDDSDQLRYKRTEPTSYARIAYEDIPVGELVHCRIPIVLCLDSKYQDISLGPHVLALMRRLSRVIRRLICGKKERSWRQSNGESPSRLVPGGPTILTQRRPLPSCSKCLLTSQTMWHDPSIDFPSWNGSLCTVSPHW